MAKYTHFNATTSFVTHFTGHYLVLNKDIVEIYRTVEGITNNVLVAVIQLGSGDYIYQREEVAA